MKMIKWFKKMSKRKIVESYITISMISESLNFGDRIQSDG